MGIAVSIVMFVLSYAMLSFLYKGEHSVFILALCCGIGVYIAMQFMESNDGGGS